MNLQLAWNADVFLAKPSDIRKYVCIRRLICSETPRKILGARMRTNNKLNSLMTPGPAFEPGLHWWEASILITALSLLFICFSIYFTSFQQVFLKRPSWNYIKACLASHLSTPVGNQNPKASAGKCVTGSKHGKYVIDTKRCKRGNLIGPYTTKSFRLVWPSLHNNFTV